MPKIQDKNTTNPGQWANIQGGCHCGAVKFSASVEQDSVILTCNCSICSMTGFTHLMVKHENFELTQGKKNLTHYQFNTHQADHLFCSLCGVKSFYQPRSHPDCWSINVNCLQDFELSNWQISDFDGKNWQQAKNQLQN